MLINEHVALVTSMVALVPYCEHHVFRYHAWMQDHDIQEATASEPLSLDDEYNMQRSWRTDGDKLTFISCRRAPDGSEKFADLREDELMVGDVNLFITMEDEDGSMPSLVGELELMIAEKVNQNQGLGRASLLVFLRYITEHEDHILCEYSKHHPSSKPNTSFNHLRVRVNAINHRSLSLFQSIGFTKVKSEPNFFGELELRRKTFDLATLGELLESAGILDYEEVPYASKKEE